MNKNRAYVVNMCARLLTLDFTGELNIDYTQCYNLFVKLELRKPLSNDNDWSLATYDRVYCYGCGCVHKLPVGINTFTIPYCSLCVDRWVTLKHSRFVNNFKPTASTIDILPLDLRKEIVNKFLDEREIAYGLQRGV